MSNRTCRCLGTKQTGFQVRLAAILCVAIGLAAGSAAFAAPLEPLRAVYLHPAPFADGAVTLEARAARIAEILSDARDCGLTTLLPYANTSGGRAYYPSRYLRPAGKAGDDTLGLLAREAQARGLSLMPAICVLVSGYDLPQGILETHPDWALRKPSGEPMGWISPAHAEARAWVVGMIQEIVAHVQPAGVLLDYLRYPNEEVLLDPASAAAFDAASPPDEAEAARKERLQRFKEESLNILAEEINRALRKQQPELRIGLYTWGPHVPFNHPVAQCWPDWIHNNYIDIVNVSGYCYRKNYGEEYLDVFEKRIRDSVELAQQAGAPVSLSFALGMHTSHGAIESASEVATYRSLAEKAGCPGVAVFAWAGLEKFLPDVIQGEYLRDVTPGATAAAGWKARLTVDLGVDQGQNFGSLFEAVGPDGKPVAGAGFLGAYNTYYRASRHMLHFYVKPPHAQDSVQATRFPRPSDSCHHYLFDIADTVYAVDRTGTPPIHRWETEAGQWTATDPPQAVAFDVGSHRLECFSNRLTVDGREAFRFDASQGTAGSFYYAQGWLFFHVYEADSPERRTAIHACPWDLEAQPEPDLSQTVVLPLTAPGEFLYAYGQLNNDVYVGSNNGGFYRFRQGQWSTLRKADPTTSFQLYAMVNYRERLLMGQYPSGELFEVEGDELKQLNGWPPCP
ncbi:MAG TPA: family 10 glycosylhydrolase, partial [Candidatus Hydrogenedentes bacterium]|nr:family 10 glycosylhydrolase [Candidatus Hydrogenedentota bacterium]